jgi:SAM-dependent methyltransferase
MADVELDPAALRAETRRIWDAKAQFWDGLMGADGNDFYRTVVRPAQNALLALQWNEVVLDLACGNGLVARELARVASRVIACDVSARLIELARARSLADGITNVDYAVVDATDEQALRALGEQHFDAAVCSMALMDIPEIEPLMRAVRAMLKPRGRFVFTLMHPCFNHQGTQMVEELDDLAGNLVPRFSMKVSEYVSVPVRRGMGAPGEPEPHLYFHRALSRLVGAAFAAGFVIDGLEEPAFPEREPGRRSFDWGNYSQIPPVLAVRLRPVGSSQ